MIIFLGTFKNGLIEDGNAEKTDCNKKIIWKGIYKNVTKYY